MKRIPRGVYPVMITPYTPDNKIDFSAVDEIIEFYIRGGCPGVFAVCQSSEMFFLSEDERVSLARRVVEAAKGRLCVVASGHVSDSLSDQIRELGRIAETGVDACVMVSNRLAAPDESDDVLIERMNAILNALPNVAFGMYECPYPYKRPLTDRVLTAMAESGRFAFIKDTCCNAETIAHRLEVLAGRIQLFNANAATLLESLASGADGFSGIMANFHPEPYVWLTKNFASRPEKASALAAELSLLSSMESCCYTVCAKVHMDRVGVRMTPLSRVRDAREFGYAESHTVNDLILVEQAMRQWIKE